MSVNDRYTIVTPDDLQNIDPDFCWSATSIDYDSHFAYAEYIANRRLTRSIGSFVKFLKSILLVSFKRAICYELIPREIRNPVTVKSRLKLIITMLLNMFRMTGSYNRMQAIGKSEEILEQLRNRGICTVIIPDDERNDLIQASVRSFNDLLERRKSAYKSNRDFDESRSFVRRDTHGELFEVIERILSNAGIIVAASRYLGRESKLVDANPQINDKTDNFWTRIFPDLDADIPPTAYFHRDSSGGDLKAIIYMSHVGFENGPFSYVVGSNKVRLGKVDNLICEANDHNGFSGNTREARMAFSALPRKLRQKGTFGNDLLADDKLSVEIKKASWEVVGKQGSIVLFDTKGIHRGGLLNEGMRKVITCVIG